jgi:hypothetical protein
VYYGLTHQEIKALRAREDDVRKEIVKLRQADTQFIQLGYEYARAVLNDWQALPDRLED